MASHDTEFRTRRAASQDESAQMQKLNEELRKLKERIERETSKKSGTKGTESNMGNPKS